jgi:hypothetical protein
MPEPPPIAPGEEAQGIRITDGDTVNVRTANGSQASIRLIGIDPPETKHPDLPVMCEREEATVETTARIQLAEGRLILETEAQDGVAQRHAQHAGPSTHCAGTPSDACR